MTSQQMIQTWLQAKEEERIAIEVRREIEDKLVAYFEVPESFEGTSNKAIDNFEVKIVGRMSRKVDGDKAQEIAQEHGLVDHLGSLFRWKPEINAAAWKAADESITKPLLDAITTTPSRPSFSITLKDK